MTTLLEARRHCADLVRQADKDRFLAALFAPEAERADLFALYAFNIEVSRVRELVSDPLPGEMRLQWWRDALEGLGHGDVDAHPVAAALIDALKRHAIPEKPLTDLIEARTFDLYDDPMPSQADLEGYLGETSSFLMQVGAMMLDEKRDPGIAEIAGHAGVAYGLAGLLRALPLHAMRGQMYLPADLLARHGVAREEVFAGRYTVGLKAALAELRAIARDHIDKVRDRLRDIPSELAPALLPAALARPYLDRMERADYDPFITALDVPQWRRQWILWRAARRAG